MQGFEPQIFSNFPDHDLIFMEGEGDKIKSQQASKRYRTLPKPKRSLLSNLYTVEPGQMTSMHRHDFDYSFVAIKPSRLGTIQVLRNQKGGWVGLAKCLP